MAIDYSIKAIPTVYNGRRYRSRLEARWAAFFDLLGWTHEYEPFDLGDWSPDFLFSGGRESVLIEVKPTDPFTRTDENLSVRRKMVGTVGSERTGYRLLYLGTSPRIENRRLDIGATSSGQRDDEGKFVWGPASIFWLAHPNQPSMLPELFWFDPATTVWTGVFSGIQPSRDGTRQYSYPDHTMGVWSEATNVVQWRGRDA